MSRASGRVTHAREYYAMLYDRTVRKQTRRQRKRIPNRRNHRNSIQMDRHGMVPRECPIRLVDLLCLFGSRLGSTFYRSSTTPVLTTQPRMDGTHHEQPAAQTHLS